MGNSQKHSIKFNNLKKNVQKYNYNPKDVVEEVLNEIDTDKYMKALTGISEMDKKSRKTMINTKIIKPIIKDTCKQGIKNMCKIQKKDKEKIDKFVNEWVDLSTQPKRYTHTWGWY